MIPSQFESNLFMALSHTLVWEKSQEFGNVNALAFDFTSNTSSGTSSTAFQRKGVTQSQKGYSLPSDIASLIRSSMDSNTVPAQVATADQNFLLDLLSRDNANQPGVNILQALQQLSAGDFTGIEALKTIIARNPFSTNYEAATSDLYNRTMNVGRSNAQSGPMNVRGGQARQGFELADLDTQMGQNRFKDIHDASMREAGEVQQAVQLANTIEGMRRGTSMSAQQAQVSGEHARTAESLDASQGLARSRASNLANLQLAAELLGTQGQSTNEDLKGSGQQIQSQAGTGWNAGITCCFIFLEALNGTLPKVVRQGRDDYNTPNRRAGYCWVSSWLVPAMRRWRIVAWLVNLLIVKPFIRVGEVVYGEDTSLWGTCKATLLLPYCFLWFWTWSLIGSVKGACYRYVS